MKNLAPDYSVYDEQYTEALSKNWKGWGGDERIENGKIFLDRLFLFEGTPYKGRVLELGCGEGNISRYLYEKGFKVTGIDVSKVAIKWAKKKAKYLKYNIDYYIKDLTCRNSIPNKNYDLIVDGNCFHCIIGDDRVTFLENIFEVLNKDGFLFISSLLSKTSENEKIIRQGLLYRHIPTLRNIIKELSLAGFEVVHQVVHKREVYDHINIHAIKNANKANSHGKI
jgi:2-polyprenyl-3-methyl-5-hydroxy-6-metoxy-1,4-benzoquinol methylase